MEKKSENMKFFGIRITSYL